MRIVHYGNACFSLFHNGVHILCDPWLEAPAVAGGWEKFPPTPIRVKDIPKPDYLYISHIHSDHCEPETLQALDKEIPVIGLSREPTYLEKMLRRAGFRNLLLVPEGKPTEVAPGLTVETFGATFDHVVAAVIDSSVLFDFGDYVAVNCNDNSPEEAFCRDVAGRYSKVDLAFLPCSGGGSYPAMYGNLSDEEKDRIIQQALEKKFSLFTQAVDLIKPAVTVPVAGGYTVRGLHPAKVNWQQIRKLNLMEIAEYHSRHGRFQSKIFPMQPGMELDAQVPRMLKGSYRPWTQEELEAYFRKMGSTPAAKAVTTTCRLPGLFRLVCQARANLWRRQTERKMFPAYQVYLEVTGEPNLWEIPLDQESAREIPRDSVPREPYLRITLDQDTLLEWMLGFEDFNMIDSGHRVGYFRSPNRYVQEVYYLMSLLRF